MRISNFGLEPISEAPLVEGPLNALVHCADTLTLAETIVAFANTEGGEIYLLNAQSFSEANAHLVTAGKRVSPSLICSPPVRIDTEGRAQFRVKVPRSLALHALVDGRVLVRRGAQNRPLGGQEIQRLADAKSSGDFEVSVLSEATRKDFSEELITEYVEKRNRRSRQISEAPLSESMREINAMDSAGRATVSGVLTFCDEPQRWLPQSSIVFVKFIGTTPRGAGGLAGYSRREEITGPLPRLVERTWQYIWSEMAVSAVVQGLEREETTEYPPFAVREAIVNAVCHRDYRLRGRRIEVRMFADRLEVISPGGLPGFVTVENIIHEHYSRNPRIVQNLFQWGYIEELGLGIDRMVEVMEEAGQKPPTFDARANSFTVTLYNAREHRTGHMLPPDTNQRQERALRHLRQHGSITNRTFRELCKEVSAETLRLDLVDLVNKGLAQKVGSKKGTRYILPPGR